MKRRTKAGSSFRRNANARVENHLTIFVNTLIIILTAYFIEMIFEVGLGNVVAWCPLLFCYYAVNLEKAAMKKSKMKKTDMAEAPVDKLITD